MRKAERLAKSLVRAGIADPGFAWYSVPYRLRRGIAWADFEDYFYSYLEG